MSADVIILPVVRIEREALQEVHVIQVRLPQHYWRRLSKLARDWNTSEQEAAEMMIAEILNGRR